MNTLEQWVYKKVTGWRAKGYDRALPRNGNCYSCNNDCSALHMN
jgi:hypothetical protein